MRQGAGRAELDHRQRAAGREHRRGHHRVGRAAHGGRLGGVDEKHVDGGQHVREPADPLLRGVPVEVQRSAGAGGVRGLEEAAQSRRQPRLQVEGAHMDVSRTAQKVLVDHRGRERVDAAREGDDGAVVAARQGDGEPRGEIIANADAAQVDTTASQLLEHEASRGVGADHAGESGAQAEPRRRAGHDAGRAAHGEGSALDELLGLPVGELPRRAVQHDVGVGVTDDQQIAGVAHRRPPAASLRPAACGAFTAAPPASCRARPPASRRPGSPSAPARVPRRRWGQGSRPAAPGRGRLRAPRTR